MELELVNFKQAETLKELGFPQHNNNYCYLNNEYHDDMYDFSRGELICIKQNPHAEWLEEYNNIPKEFLTDAPYLELVAKWLRDEKELNICVYRTACGWLYMIESIPSGTDIYSDYDDDDGDDESTGQWTTYEKALSAGIDKVIEMIKNK